MAAEMPSGAHSDGACMATKTRAAQTRRLLKAAAILASLNPMHPSTHRPSFCLRSWRIRSIKMDDCFDNMIEWRVLGRKGHAQLQFVALDLALANDALDLPL
jgi:hypothetical protein